MSIKKDVQETDVTSKLTSVIIKLLHKEILIDIQNSYTLIYKKEKTLDLISHIYLLGHGTDLIQINTLQVFL